MRNSLEVQASRFLFHLGKGLWKSVPILGPIVEEVFYEQFRHELAHRVSALSDEDLEKLIAVLPDINIEDIDERLTHISEEIRQFGLQQFGFLLSCMERDQAEITSRLGKIEEHLDLIPSIRDIVLDLETKVGDDSSLRLALSELERKRRNWIKRISNNQRLLLSDLPDDFTSVDEIWPLCQDLMPKCTYKEYRFRLHELEWLGLVERTHHKGRWLYRRSKDGKGALNG